MKEAMDKVKEEFGSDAVILHTRKLKTGGIFGYGGKKMVEITAAIEDNPPQNKKKSSYLPPPDDLLTRPRGVLPKQVLNTYKTTATEFLAPAEEQAPVMQDLELPVVKTSEAQREARIVPKEDVKMEQESPAPSSAEQEKKIHDLQRELDKMKLMLEKVINEDREKKDLYLPTLKDALAEQEVEESLLEDIIQDIGKESMLLPKDSEEARTVLINYLSKLMPDAPGIEIEKGTPKIAALIGATGVGKTTTLAKIASRFVLEQGLKAVLITADTYRISAVEQLKTYSDIIGLPLEIVYSPVELKKAIDKHSDKQLILIDTAGRSQHNDYQLNELHDLLVVNDKIEKHLVLSSTTKYKDIINIIRKFSFCAPDKIIFTKTDETCSVGMILNLLVKYPLNISYFTNGQSVPDDIFPATPANLAELLLR